MTLGVYSNFPPNVHYIKTYTSTAKSSRQLQQKIFQQLLAVNRRELSFEEVSIPTIPNGVVIFEFGLAEEGNFNFLSETEAKRAQDYVSSHQVGVLDFFCSIRYYRQNDAGRQALKFDYFMCRMVFGRGTFEVQVFHERGPIYLSAEDLTEFVVRQVNEGLKKLLLKETQEQI